MKTEEVAKVMNCISTLSMLNNMLFLEAIKKEESFIYTRDVKQTFQQRYPEIRFVDRIIDSTGVKYYNENDKISWLDIGKHPYFKQVLEHWTKGLSIEERTEIYIEYIKNNPEMQAKNFLIDDLMNDNEIIELIITSDEVEKSKNYFSIEDMREYLEKRILNLSDAHIHKILANVKDDRKKAYIITKTMNKQEFKDKEEEAVKRSLLESYIKVLDTEEEEIKRLESCESVDELIPIANMTTRGAGMKWIEGNPARVIILDTYKDFNECFCKAKDDDEKAIMLMALRGNAIEKTAYYKYIKDDYIKMKITDGALYFNEDKPYNLDEFEKYLEMQIPQISEYRKICDNIQKCNTEEEKMKLIVNLKDNDLKKVFLRDIKEIENKEKIIESFTRTVDKDLENLDNKARAMIIDFFEDYYNGEIPIEKAEKMYTTLQGTNCKYKIYAQSKIRGQYDPVSNLITLSEKMRGSYTEQTIGCLLHEYAHAFSIKDIKINCNMIGDMIEEGNADLFEEMVMNHYYTKKYGEHAKTYVTRSLYKDENAHARTLLYPLQQKGQDMEAFIDYLLGDKKKYFEMVLSPEKANELPRDYCGNICVSNLNLDEVYKCHEGEYVEQKNSIYLRRNNVVNTYIRKDKRMSVEKVFRKTLDVLKNISIKELVKKAIGEDMITAKEINQAEKMMEKEQIKTNEKEITYDE